MSRSLAIGTTIQGYRIDRVLSDEGNFAVVYLAYDTDGDRVSRRREKVAGRLGRWQERYGAAAAATRLDPGPLLALKEYMPRYYGIRRGNVVAATSGEAEVFAWGRERFARESLFLSEHSHPNVVAVYDLFTANNTEYYVMERLTGDSLAMMIEASGVQSEATVRRWLLPVLDGLASVERRDANHLDLSPDNIMFRTPGGDPVLVDFGAARIGGSPPVHSSHLVTNTNFAAPEKRKETSRKLSAPSDIYSLAAIVNYALSGETPTPAEKRMKGQAPISEAAAAARARQASAAFLSVIDKAFMMERHERFSDARVFSESVAATGGRSGPTPPSNSGTGKRQLGAGDRRNLILLAALGALAVLSLIAALLLR